MRPFKNGVMVEELMDNRAPYKLWMADLWTCPKCNHSIAAGFPARPLLEHFEPDYDTQRKMAEFSFGGKY